MNQFISLKHIEKIYSNNVQAVYDFNLDIKQGEFIVFVGPSGCGKSTTLRMIAGLEDISGGELYINNKYVNDKPAKDRDLTMVFQNYALFPYMTVYDNIAFGLQIKRKNKEEINKKVLEAAKILQLEDYLKAKPRSLSGGQRQRIALGRAIVSDASIFLMDEPLSNLDAKLRVQMRSEIIRIHKQMQATTIYVTHDQTEAMTMADRIVVMKNGYIQQIGTPIEIYSHPLNTFVATFIGAPTMNLFKVKYKEGKILFDNGHAIAFSQEIHDTFYQNKIKDIDYKLANNPADYAQLMDKKLAYEKCLKEEHALIIGVRPEDVCAFSTNDNAFKIQISIAELLGKEYYVHTNFQGVNFIFKTSNDIKLNTNQELSISFTNQNIHIFDEISTERIEIAL